MLDQILLAAFSPAASWLIFGAVAAVAVSVYLAASAWLDRRDADLDRMNEAWLDRERRRQARGRW